MLEIINQFLEGTSWLYTRIYENPIIFVDYWLFMHILSGILLMLLLVSLRAKQKLITLAFILLLWEIIEIIFLKISFNIFLSENLHDQITDVIMGMISGLITFFILRNKHSFTKFKIIDPSFVSALISATTIAFIWVGSYHYHYSRPEFNSPGLNYWAMILWFFGYMSIFKFYTFLEKKISNFVLRIPILWITYFIVLITVEYIGRYVVAIREVSSAQNQPLIFDLVWGSPILHFVYSFAPIIALAIYLPLRKICSTAVKSSLD
jgi:hypothetical protein